MIEGVCEVRSVRRIGKAEAWQIRGYHVIAIGQCWNEFPEHVRGRREAVEQ
jgi:hypothetical protein